MEIKEIQVENALEYALKTKNGIKVKSDKNKCISTFLFLVILISTILSPILIVVDTECKFISKFLPAFLTACAALATSWIQLRKPNDRWILYRTAQRDIEFEIDQYKFENGEYNSDFKDKILADRVSQRAHKLHFEWVPMVPKSEDFRNNKTNSTNEV